MATTIPQRELRSNNAAVLSRVADGESFVVTRNGVPVADVVPHVTSNNPPQFPLTRDLQATPAKHLDRELWVADIRRSEHPDGRGVGLRPTPQ